MGGSERQQGQGLDAAAEQLAVFLKALSQAIDRILADIQAGPAVFRHFPDRLDPEFIDGVNVRHGLDMLVDPGWRFPIAYQVFTPHCMKSVSVSGLAMLRRGCDCSSIKRPAAPSEA